MINNILFLAIVIFNCIILVIKLSSYECTALEFNRSRYQIVTRIQIDSIVIARKHRANREATEKLDSDTVKREVYI